jgi:hypothetical protein
MWRKTTVLAMALSVVAAMALPGTASAVWKHHNTAIQQDVQIGLTGTYGFQSESGGSSCQITSAIKFFAGQTTGQVESFGPHPTNATTNCTTSGGLSQCQVETEQPTNLSWPVHTTGTAQTPTIQITFGDIHTDLIKKNLFCLYEHSTWTGGSLTIHATPASGNTVTAFTISGSTQGHLYTDTANPMGTTTAMTLGGTLNVESPNSGTYSI